MRARVELEEQSRVRAKRAVGAQPAVSRMEQLEGGDVRQLRRRRNVGFWRHEFCRVALERHELVGGCRKVASLVVQDGHPSEVGNGHADCGREPCGSIDELLEDRQLERARVPPLAPIRAAQLHREAKELIDRRRRRLTGPLGRRRAVGAAKGARAVRGFVKVESVVDWTGHGSKVLASAARDEAGKPRPARPSKVALQHDVRLVERLGHVPPPAACVVDGSDGLEHRHHCLIDQRQLVPRVHHRDREDRVVHPGSRVVDPRSDGEVEQRLDALLLRLDRA